MSFIYNQNSVENAIEFLEKELPKNNRRYFLMEDIVPRKETNNLQEAVEWFKKGNPIQVRTDDWDTFRFGPGKSIPNSSERTVRVTCNTLNFVIFF